MEFDLTKPYCYYFNEICKIPHGSFNEQAISEYIVSFAKEHNLKYVQDEMNNVVIYKEASDGYEEYDPLMLQGHMDMVCEAESGLDFDFENQPIETYVDEEGLLRAKGTTLGADDGMGVAEMLAILADDSLKHPALECVFTVQEEVGLFGALGLDKTLIHSHRMISLDGGGEKVICISSAGGLQATNTIPIQKVNNDKSCYSIKVTGLKGGHSGAEIHNERGNANKLVGRILKELSNRNCSFNLVSWNGGSKDNAICRESVAIIASDEDFTAKVIELEDKIKVEFVDSDPGFKVVFEEVDKVKECFDDVSSKNVIDYVYMIPNGMQHKSMAIEGLTLTSLNLGILKTNEDSVTCLSSIRSALNEALDDLVDVLSCVASYTGGSIEVDARYPAWAYNPNSKIRETFKKVFSENHEGEELECHAVHGGLECAIFTQIDGGMDIITCGPISEGYHTPDEYLDLESWDRTYQMLCDIIASIDEKY